MALFDFEIIYSGMVSPPEYYDVEDGILVYVRFTDLFGDLDHQTYLYLNPQIEGSGFNAIQVGGMATGSPIQYTGIVVANKNPPKSVVINVAGDEYDCKFRADESFEIDDVATVFEYLNHSAEKLNDFIWFATKRPLSNPEILSINLNLIGSGGSGINKVNVNPYTGVVHYGSGLGS